METVRSLPGNRHPHALRDKLTQCFSYASSALSKVSASRLLLGPRFFVAAVKKD
jgi:hypothetical protein